MSSAYINYFIIIKKQQQCPCCPQRFLNRFKIVAISDVLNFILKTKLFGNILSTFLFYFATRINYLFVE